MQLFSFLSVLIHFFVQQKINSPADFSKLNKYFRKNCVIFIYLFAIKNEIKKVVIIRL
ncbi:unnamed protein product [Brugia timori]|uniref:Uncharacterized protein n=1 Tax=Brugia timori TaxID=42155 RepID=A0A3P7TU77_9BILA|nr:unnamed protein product [Brugia timori]